MRATPAKLKADLEIIRCATARRGGRPCNDWPCECTVPWRLTAKAGRILRPFTRDKKPTAAQRAVLKDFLRAARQETAESALAEKAPNRFSYMLPEMLFPGSNIFSNRQSIEDMDRLCLVLRYQNDPPPSQRLVVEAIRWAKANVCRAGRSRGTEVAR